jgi:hypothetical protein
LIYFVTVNKSGVKAGSDVVALDTELHMYEHMRVYPKVSGLATWNENCIWYSSLQLRAVLPLFDESV